MENTGGIARRLNIWEEEYGVDRAVLSRKQPSVAAVGTSMGTSATAARVGQSGNVRPTGVTETVLSLEETRPLGTLTPVLGSQMRSQQELCVAVLSSTTVCLVY